MRRIVEPLTQMGARFMGRSEGSLAPLAVRGGDLRGISYEMPVASAQLKSSILIAGMHADGETKVREPAASRDHTERMMLAMGADVATEGLGIAVRPSELSAMDVRVPGDISGAAFWLVAGCCHPNARLTVEGIGINPSRTGVLDVLRSMGARIGIQNAREDAGEPNADLVAESSSLRGTEISGEIIPRVIDELPVIALAACFAEGTTVIRDAGELRVKESDRIRATVDGLSRLGARIEERPDGMVIEGVGQLTGAECESHGDHRIAMTMGIAGLLSQGVTTVGDAEAASVSYPDFWTEYGPSRAPSRKPARGRPDANPMSPAPSSSPGESHPLLIVISGPPRGQGRGGRQDEEAGKRLALHGDGDDPAAPGGRARRRRLHLPDYRALPPDDREGRAPGVGPRSTGTSTGYPRRPWPGPSPKCATSS